MSSSTRVQIYNSETREVEKTISKFRDLVHCVNYREDGKLIITGSEDGAMKVFDVATRTPLRVFKGHVGTVKVTKFSPLKTQVISGGNDKTLRQWDLVTQQPITVIHAHQDYIRQAVTSNSSPNMWATGSYDHTIKLWDLRNKENIITFNHNLPVEDLVIFPTGSIVISAGGNSIKIWDIVAGKLIDTISNHQKTITSLTIDNSGNRLITGSIDQYVKIYDTKTYNVNYTFNYPSPVISVAISNDLKQLAVGLTDNTIQLRSRIARMNEIVLQKEKQIGQGNMNFNNKNSKNIETMKEDYTINVQKKVKLKTYDKLLKTFQYKNALDNSLEYSEKDPIIVVSMLEELNRRNALSIAIAGRNEVTLIPLLQFLLHNINDRRWNIIIIKTTNLLLDYYTTIIGHSNTIDDLLNRLHTKLLSELNLQKHLFELIGTLDTLFAQNASSNSLSTLPANNALPIINDNNNNNNVIDDVSIKQLS